MIYQTFFIPSSKTILLTSTFTEIQKRMAMGINPLIEYVEISNSEILNFNPKNISFTKVDEESIRNANYIFQNYQFEIVAFHGIKANLNDIHINAKHLVIGEKCKFEIESEIFKNLNEITFLSLKSYTGKISSEMQFVTKLIIWYEQNKCKEIIGKFPNLKYFQINNGSLTELNLTNQTKLEYLQLHRCPKLENVILPSNLKLKEVIIDNCKKLNSNYLIKT